VKFAGITQRGRRAAGDDLYSVARDLAFLASHEEDLVVTVQPVGEQGIWFVYETQDALDVDLSRGIINRKSPGWFAVIEAS
jgi:hypothetical protein